MPSNEPTPQSKDLGAPNGPQSGLPDPYRELVSLRADPRAPRGEQLPTEASSKRIVEDSIKFADAIVERYGEVTPEEFSLFRKILQPLSEQERGVFLNSTLPELMTRWQVPLITWGVPTDEKSKILESLLCCAQNGSLGVTLPLLIEILPDKALSHITGRLMAISLATGEAAREVLQDLLPRCIEADKSRFDPTALFHLQQLCELSREHTATILSNLVAEPEAYGLPLTRRLVVLLLVLHSQNLNPLSVVENARFCEALTSRMQPNSDREYSKLMASATKLFVSWEERYRADACKAFIEFFDSFETTPFPGALQRTMEIMEIPALSATRLLQGLTPRGRRQDRELLDPLMQQVAVYHSHFDVGHLEPLGELIRVAVERKQADLLVHVVGGLCKTFGVVRTAGHFPFLADAFAGFSEADFFKLRRELPSIWDRARHLLLEEESVDKSPLTYILVGILKGGAEQFSSWKISPQRVREIYESHTEDRAAAYELPQGFFTVPAISKGACMAVRDGVYLDWGFIEGQLRCFEPLASQEESARLLKIEALTERYVRTSRYLVLPDLFPMLVEISQRNSVAVFAEAVRTALPLFPAALKTSPVRFDPSLRDRPSTIDSCYDYLEAIRLMIADGLPVVLMRYGMERRWINEIKRHGHIRKLEKELRKFVRNNAHDTWEVGLRLGCTVLDRFYDQAAESCILARCRDDFYNPKFQPLRAIVLSTMDLIGTWYTLRSPIDGKESIILAGGGVRRSISKAIHPHDLARGLIHSLLDVVDESRFGGLYQAVGPAPGAEGLLWVNQQGRVAQNVEAASAILRFASSEVISLPPHEIIHFPSGYQYGPITQVVRLFRRP